MSPKIEDRRKKYTSKYHGKQVNHKLYGSLTKSIKKEKDVENTEDAKYWTLAALILVIAAFIVIGRLILKYINSPIAYDQKWASTALLQLSFLVFGFFGINLVRKQGIFPLKFKKFDSLMILQGFFLAVGSVIIQYLTALKLSIEDVDRAYYFIFAAVAEEVFFRGFIMESMFRFFKKVGLYISIPLQAVFFAAMHTNYYNNMAALVAVFIGGVFLGMAYAWKRDITINIIGHGILNLIAAIQKFGILTLLMMA